MASELQTIPRAKLPGRPKNYVPVRYSAVNPSVTPRGESDSKKLIGGFIARRLGDDGRIYIGRIGGHHSLILCVQ